MSYFMLKSSKVVSFRSRRLVHPQSPIAATEASFQISSLKFLDPPLLLIQCNVIKFIYIQKS